MLIVEDGSIVDGANSYVSVQDADEFVEDFFTGDKKQQWDELTQKAKELQLIDATEFLDILVRWDSSIMKQSQPLNWPREKFYDAEDRVVDGNTIPEIIKTSVIKIAVEDLVEDIYEDSVYLRSESYGDSQDVYASPVKDGGNSEIDKIRKKLFRKGYASSRTTFVVAQRA